MRWCRETAGEICDSSHGLLTPVLEIVFDFPQSAYAFALKVSLACDGIDRRGGEPVLDLQSIPNHALQQFALRLSHCQKLLRYSPLTRLNHQWLPGFALVHGVDEGAAEAQGIDADLPTWIPNDSALES